MATATIRYLGDLRTECTHEQSGTTINTDAPVDNNGLGRTFSPTDLIATGLASCATTIIAMYAAAHDIDISGMQAEVTKTMSANPRRIAKLDVVFTMPNREFSDRAKLGIQRAANTCPVKESLHPETEQNFIFNWAK